MPITAPHRTRISQWFGWTACDGNIAHSREELLCSNFSSSGRGRWVTSDFPSSRFYSRLSINSIETSTMFSTTRTLLQLTIVAVYQCNNPRLVTSRRTHPQLDFNPVCKVLHAAAATIRDWLIDDPALAAGWTDTTRG